MPYVQRDNDGNVKGLYARPQPGYAEDFLDDDHPEVVAYRTAHPMPDALLKPPTEEKQRQLLQDEERIESERLDLQRAVWAFNQQFSQLEIALSALLYEAINVNPKSSHLAYAVYYSPDGFRGRYQLVDNVIKQLIHENDVLSDLGPLWNQIVNSFVSIGRTRNKLAHGMPITLAIRGKNYVRFTDPVFNTNKVGQVIDRGQVPGLTSSDINTGARKAYELQDRVDEVNRVIDAFHRGAQQPLRERLAQLESNLQISRHP